MSIHDWALVKAGIFHDFHHAWIEEIKRALNHGLLPADYYAMAEQWAGGLGPDVLALQDARPASKPTNGNNPSAPAGAGGGLALVAAPPQVRFTASTEPEQYARKRSRVTIRHSSDDRVVAIVEIVSPGNKASQDALLAFTSKVAELPDSGVHLLVIDLFPAGPRDPQGIHPAIWSRFIEDGFQLPSDKPLTLVAYYSADEVKNAYIEPVAIGDVLPDMPLFLTPGFYVPVPLEGTYQAAWEEVPRRWREVLESPPVQER